MTIFNSREKALLATYGEWGARYRRYLIDHNREKYYTLLSAGEFFNYITQIDVKAEHLYDKTVQDLMRQHSLTAELKRDDPELWKEKLNELCKQAAAQVLQLVESGVEELFNKP